MLPLRTVYRARRRSLRALAKELQIPDTAAEQLIDDILYATLLRPPKTDPDRFLAAALTAAAKRLKEQGE